MTFSHHGLPKNSGVPDMYVVFVCHGRRRTPEQLCARIRSTSEARIRSELGRSVAGAATLDMLGIETAFVRRLMRASGEIEMESLQMSLRCPLSLGRIQVPVRGARCRHVQCFDLMKFVEYASMVNSDNCPVCSKKNARFSDLIVSPFVQDALRRYPNEDEVVLLPSGEIKPPTAAASLAQACTVADRRSNQKHNGNEVVNISDDTRKRVFVSHDVILDTVDLTELKDEAEVALKDGVNPGVPRIGISPLKSQDEPQKVVAPVVDDVIIIDDD
eukprot:CAMPEP_0185850258 /NCGR_PEP_ID=MMETSP1354-20130828/4463_1 /TAXON_ID=708628 /ORGANISM="Erythrolobus madagascarensis, Strain CCMP3276" /LENGTH=272 /DNA_ID=CAMNT_0028550915 /DNA_START=60 /DNA_END=878 /DNA_ORIENTATION=+